MRMMKTSWAIKLVAILLLTLACGCVFADCHGGGCFDDCDRCGECAHVCRCVLVQDCSVDVSLTVTPLVHDDGLLILSAAGTDIFRPPTLSA